jgi:deoxyribose-phosphate aldolase
MTVTRSELAGYFEYTVLRPDATAADVDNVCLDAVRLGVKSVCVNPVHIKLANWLLKDEEPLPVCSVGFPTGATLGGIKSAEAAEAVRLGAREVNMVMNLAAFKAADHRAVVQDIQGVITAAGVPVKVIVEASLLDMSLLAQACSLCLEAGAKAVISGSGYGTQPVRLAQIRTLRKACDCSLEVIAAGGVRGFKRAMALVDAGADRICSSTVPEILGSSSR